MVNGILGMDYELTQTLANLQRQLTALSTQPILLNASTGQDGGKGLTTDKNGLHVFNPAGAEVARVETTDGALVMFDGAGNEIARYGLLTHTAAGTYGAEVLVSGTWVQLGAQTSTWGTLSGIPGTYNTGNQKWTPDAHAAAHAAAGSDPVSISGSQVTSAVGQANGSQYGFSNPVAGTSFYALWVGNDTGYHFGTNVSTARHKRNIRRHRISPERVLALKPVVYTKPANNDYVEYGLIAEQAAETLPEIVQWMDGKIHGVRYDLLAVALLETVQHQQREIDHQKAVNAAIRAALHKAGIHVDLPPEVTHPAHHAPETKANNPPPHPEQPLPYTIEED